MRLRFENSKWMRWADDLPLLLYPFFLFSAMIHSFHNPTCLKLILYSLTQIASENLREPYRSVWHAIISHDCRCCCSTGAAHIRSTKSFPLTEPTDDPKVQAEIEQNSIAEECYFWSLKPTITALTVTNTYSTQWHYYSFGTMFLTTKWN